MRLTVGLKNKLDTISGRSDLRRLHAFQEYLKSKDRSDFCFREPQSPQTDYTLEFDGEELDRGDLDILTPVPVHYLYNVLKNIGNRNLEKFHEQWTEFTKNMGNCGTGNRQQDLDECFIRPLLDRIIEYPIVSITCENVPGNWDQYTKQIGKDEPHYVIYIPLPNISEPVQYRTIGKMFEGLTQKQIHTDPDRLKKFKSEYPTYNNGDENGNWGVKPRYTLTYNGNFVCLHVRRKNEIAGSDPNRMPITINTNLPGIKDSSGDDITLNLQSFIIHTGVDGNGHYIAYVRHGVQWFKCDDSVVTSVNDMTNILKDNTDVTTVMYTKDDDFGDKSPLKGLTNSNNKCYRNASLQMMWAESSIRAAIEAYKDKFEAYYQFIKFIE